MVELLVAMTISLFMLLAIAVVYSTSKTGFAFANNTVRMSEDAAFALEMMSRDIRIAGYAGCSGTSVAVDAAGVVTYTPKLNAISGLILNTASNKPNPFIGVSSGELGAQIFTANNSVWGFAANNSSAMSILGGSTTSYTASTTEPMLYLAGGSNQALQISDAVATATSPINIPANTYGWSNSSPVIPTFLIISDCKGSEVFRASSAQPASGKFVITHDAIDNNSENLANSYGSDAIVTSLNTSVYFVATRTGATTASLYRRYFNGTAAVSEEIVPNVEKITFQYGINTSNTSAGLPTYQVDAYEANPDSITDWSRVVSIRMGLIMISEEDGQGTTKANQNIPWLGGTYASPSDARLRRAYSTTVSIRNRMGL